MLYASAIASCEFTRPLIPISSKIPLTPTLFSPFEKFLYAYDFVTSRVYVEESSLEPVETSRNLIEILNGDKSSIKTIQISK